MHVTTSSPLRVASRVWPTLRRGWTLTVICKATYRLQPGESALHGVQEPVHEQDICWDNDPRRSLLVASDLAPFKPRADVVLVGSAYAPGRVPARSVMTRLLVGEVDKSLEAWCDRVWTQDGQLREGARVIKIPLRYERATGGPDSWNPVGVRHDAAPDAYGMVPLPNLQPPGLHITRRGDFIEPIGFGPIAPSWPWRRERLGRYADSWPYERWWEQPLPEAFDPAFFNNAPRDQQLTELHDNQRLVLEHLHPDHPRLVTSLPGLRPRALVERGSTGREEIPLLCDTLWIDTERGLCTLVWRGRLALPHAEEPGRVVVALERAGAPGIPWVPKPTTSEALAGEVPPTQPRLGGTHAHETRTAEAERMAFEEVDEDAAVLRTLPGSLVENTAPVLPFAPAPAGPMPASSRAASFPASPASSASVSSGRRADTGTLAPAALPESDQNPLPFVRAPAPHSAGFAPSSAHQIAAPASVSLVAPPPSNPFVAPPTSSVPIAPPPLVTRPPLLEPIAPPVAASPWEVSSMAAGPKQTVGQTSAVASAETRSTPGGNFIPESKATKPSPPRDIVEILWCDTEGMYQVRRHSSWKKLIAEARPKSPNREPDEDIPPEKRADARDRRDAAAVLTKGEVITDPERLRDALDGAISEDGLFVPPLVLTSGELEFAFDEFETLKATVAVATPLAGTDKRLKEAIDVAIEFLKTPYAQSVPNLADGMTARIRDAFKNGSPNLPAVPPRAGRVS